MTDSPRRFDVVLRRRVRESQWIELPRAEPPRQPESVSDRAKLLAVAIAVVIGAGTLLLATPLTTADGDPASPIDAFFTAVSAVTVTGLVTVDTGTHWNLFGQAVILLMIQIGGLGIMVGAGILFQLSRRGRLSLRQSLYLQDGTPSLTMLEAVGLVKRITAFTLIVEAVGWAALTVIFLGDHGLGRAVWYGLFHAVSAFCNAGFDITSGGPSLLEHRARWPLQLALIVLIQAGSLSYPVCRDASRVAVARIRHRRDRSLAMETNVVLIGNAALLAIGFVVMAAIEWRGMLAGRAVSTKLVNALFESTSARTAGFSVVDWDGAASVTEFV